MANLWIQSKLQTPKTSQIHLVRKFKFHCPKNVKAQVKKSLRTILTNQILNHRKPFQSLVLDTGVKDKGLVIKSMMKKLQRGQTVLILEYRNRQFNQESQDKLQRNKLRLKTQIITAHRQLDIRTNWVLNRTCLINI